MLRIAEQRAKELDIKTVIVATTRGNTAARAVEVLGGDEGGGGEPCYRHERDQSSGID